MTILESERCLIEGKKKNEAARNELISEQLSNKRKKVIEKAKIKAEAARLTARANAAATKLTAEAKAEATRVKGKATNETAKKALENQAEVLGGEGGSKIIELERARTLKATDKLVIPTDSKLVLGLDRELER